MASSEGVTAAHRVAATTHCGMTPTPGVATATTMLSERRHGSQDGTQHTHRQNNAFTFDTHVSLLNHRILFDPICRTQFMAIGGHNNSLIPA
jgi:hypothetical protein